MSSLPVNSVDFLPREWPLPNPYQVDVWSMDFSEFELEKHTEAIHNTLSSAELETLQVRKNEIDKRQYAVTRWLLRHLLSAYDANEKANNWVFGKSEQGKPFINQPDLDLAFSISHSHERVAIAFSKDPTLGLDIEFMRSDVKFEKIADLYFTDQETEQLKRLTPQEQKAYFFKVWTLKESIMKSTGLGFSLSMKSIETQGNPPTSICVEGYPGPWQCYQSGLTQDYQFTVTCKQAHALKVQTVNLRHFNIQG
jgi:4'-phosphopantetheinyl transferase